MATWFAKRKGAIGGVSVPDVMVIPACAVGRAMSEEVVAVSSSEVESG